MLCFSLVDYGLSAGEEFYRLRGCFVSMYPHYALEIRSEGWNSTEFPEFNPKRRLTVCLNGYITASAPGQEKKQSASEAPVFFQYTEPMEPNGSDCARW